MNKTFSEKAFEQYVYWQNQDRKTLKRINDLLKDIERMESTKESAGRNCSSINSRGIGRGALTKKIVSSTKSMNRARSESNTAKVITNKNFSRRKTRRDFFVDKKNFPRDNR